MLVLSPGEIHDDLDDGDDDDQVDVDEDENENDNDGSKSFDLTNDKTLLSALWLPR